MKVAFGYPCHLIMTFVIVFPLRANPLLFCCFSDVVHNPLMSCENHTAWGAGFYNYLLISRLDLPIGMFLMWVGLKLSFSADTTLKALVSVVCIKRI